jgi:hypothetical protein
MLDNVHISNWIVQHARNMHNVLVNGRNNPSGWRRSNKLGSSWARSLEYTKWSIRCTEGEERREIRLLAEADSALAGRRMEDHILSRSTMVSMLTKQLHTIASPMDCSIARVSRCGSCYIPVVCSLN